MKDLNKIIDDLDQSMQSYGISFSSADLAYNALNELPEAEKLKNLKMIFENGYQNLDDKEKIQKR